MSDPLADVLNRVAANSQGDAGPAPVARPSFSWGNVLNAALRLNPVTAAPFIANDIAKGTFLENERTKAGQLARIPTDVAGGIVGLPALADTVSQLTTGARLAPGLADASQAAAETVHGWGRTVGEAIAGKPLNDDILYGDPADMSANMARVLAGTILPAPAGAARVITEGASKLRTGVEAVDKGGEIGLKLLEALTPITISTKPTTPVVATNVALAGAINAGLEAYLGPSTTVADAKGLVDEKAKGTLDVAAQGAEEVQRANPVQAGVTGDPLYDAVGVGLLAVGALSYYKRDAIARALTGVRQKATGYDALDPNDATFQSLGTMLKQQYVNQPESMEQTLRGLYKSQNRGNVNQMAEDFAERTAARHGASVNTRMQSLYNDGSLPDSTVKVNPVNDLYTVYRTLDESQADLLSRALHSQRELDTRRINKIWHNLYDTQSRDLQGYVTQAQADPKVAYLFNEFLATTRKMADYMDEQKRFTSKEIKQFVSSNPNFVPENLTEEGARWLDRRNISMNGGLRTFEQLGNPFENLPRYLDEVVRSTEGKKIQRDFMQEMTRAKAAGNTWASKFIGREVTQAPGHGSAGRFVHWRNAHGESRWTEINDAVLRDSVRGATNPTALQLAGGALSKWSRIYESGAVGTLGTLTGSIFAPKSALYSTTFGTVTRQKGVAVGWLDKYVQDLTGGKMGVRGDVYTMVPDVALRAALNIGAVLVHRAGRVLHNSVVSDGFVARGLGPRTAQHAADALERVYKRSGVYELQQRGLLGPSSFMSVDPAKSFQDAKQMLEGRGVFTGTGTFIGDLLHAISSAPAMSILAMNKGKPASQVSAAIRNLAGDPGKAGAFKDAKGLAMFTNATPWGNIFIQSSARLAQAFRKDPLGVTGGIFTGIAVPSIMASMWNASAGPEYTDYQFNKRTPDRQAAGIYIAAPGLPPEQGVEIDIDPLMRPFKHLSELYAAGSLGLIDGSIFKPGNELMHMALKDFVDHSPSSATENRMTSFGEGTVPRSIMQQTLVPPMQPAIQTGLAALGVKARGYDDTRIMREKNESGYTGGAGKNPNSFLGQYMPGQMEDIVRGIGASAFANIYSMFDDTATRIKEGAQPGEAARQGVMLSTQQRYADSTKMFGSGPLFSTFLAVNPSTEAAGVLVKNKLEGIKKLDEAFNSSTLPGGTPQDVVGSRKRGFEPYIGSQPSPAPDLAMAQLGQLVHRKYQELNQAYLGANSDLYDQRQSVANSTKFSPEMKRAIMNDLSEQIIKNDRAMLQDLERYEAILSQQFGRPIKFDKIKIGSPMNEQGR